jgi:hypothetical protein
VVGYLGFTLIRGILVLKMDEDFDRDFQALEKVAVDGDGDRPKSGTYLGKYVEERQLVTGNDVDKVVYKKGTEIEVMQDCCSDLKFEKDGTISGSGFDDIDGPYTIEDEWRGSKLRLLKLMKKDSKH